MRPTYDCQEEFRQRASLLAHDLRNPLAVILGNASILLRGTPAGTPVEPVLEIRREGQRALAMIDALLESDLAVPPGPASVIAGTESIRAELRRWSPDRQLDVQLDNPLPLAAVFPIQLEQVLQNLVSNADKYSPPETSITVSASTMDDALIVSVADRGPGIPLREQERIFRNWYRLDRHIDQPGTGLGLPASKALVEGWSGQIWYEPRVGGGSKFCFTLPIWRENFAADLEELFEGARLT
jgi:two-component system sensor histidine kinase KdpD